MPVAAAICFRPNACETAEKKEPVPMAGSRKRTGVLPRRACAYRARLSASAGGVANCPHLLRSGGGLQTIEAGLLQLAAFLDAM